MSFVLSFHSLLFTQYPFYLGDERSRYHYLWDLHRGLDRNMPAMLHALDKIRKGTTLKRRTESNPLVPNIKFHFTWARPPEIETRVPIVASSNYVLSGKRVPRFRSCVEEPRWLGFRSVPSLLQSPTLHWIPYSRRAEKVGAGAAAGSTQSLPRSTTFTDLSFRAI